MSAMSLAVILAVLAVPSVTSVSHNDAVHLGCFKTNLVDTQRSYYMVNEPLSWENGISACIHRYTTHVGVQADNRTSVMSYFFCGNDLLEHSVKLEDSACTSCASPKDRLCGGPQSLSLYKIRDSTPLVIFMANYEGIRLLEVDGSLTNYSSIIQTPTSANRIRPLYSIDEFVFQNYAGNLSRSFFGHQIQKYSSPSKVEVNSSSYGFTVDWLHHTIYYCGDQWIMKYDMTSEATIQLYTIHDTACSDLAIDPYTRILFVVFGNGTLRGFSLDTQSYRTYKGGKYGLHNSRRLAVDCASQLIYVNTQLTADSNTTYIVQLDYNDTTLILLHKGTELKDSYGLDVFNGTVIWTVFSRNPRNSTIYSCKPYPTCNHENIKLLYRTTLGTENIIIYHPIRQTPTVSHLCKNAGCSHSCSRVTLFTRKCTCPEGLTFSSDNATCQAYCDNQDLWQVGYKVNREDIVTTVGDDDHLGQRFCKWKSPPGNGFNFQPCSKGLCRVIEGSHKSACSLRFTKCDPHYTLIGGRDKDSCVNGEWSSRGHLCIPCGRSKNSTNPYEDLALIHNGLVSSRGNFPWMAALYYRLNSETWEQICGGTLISPSLVLTAAHCVVLDGRNFESEDVMVGLGKLFRSYYKEESSSDISTVKEIVRQDRYWGADHWFDLDIALLVLNSSVVTGPYIMPACVDWGAAMEPKQNEVGYVAGWGKTELNTTSPMLMWASQKYVNYSTCLTMMRPTEKKIITQDKFCVIQVNGGMAEKGDSGGGLSMLRGGAHYVYGVLSTKLPLENNKMRLFTNILNDGHLIWLRRQWHRLLLSTIV